MQILLGHLVYHLMLLRPASSALSRMRVATAATSSYRRLSVEDPAELRLLLDLLPIAEVNMSAPPSPTAATCATAASPSR